MPTMMLHNSPVTYVVEGEGFPLVLAPEPQGTMDLWSAYIPLLGEMCRTIAYTPALRPDALRLFLDALRLQRLYLASPLQSWPTALQFALSAPQRLEGLLLVDAGSTPAEDGDVDRTYEGQLPHMLVPTLILTGTAPAHAAVAILGRMLPHCTAVAVPGADLQRGHAMMRFLLHCERRRNLVRGASFLL
jgi:pimeloyl-ACP methyl ester carboxylesterase